MTTSQSRRVVRATFRTTIKTLVASIAVIVTLSTAVGTAGAEPKKDVSAPGTGQVILCQGGGGTATVGTDRTPRGLNSVTVSCNGGFFDGLTCTNNQSGTNCTHRTSRGGSRSGGTAVPAGGGTGVTSTADTGTVEATGDEEGLPDGSGIAPLEVDGT